MKINLLLFITWLLFIPDIGMSAEKNPDNSDKLLEVIRDIGMRYDVHFTYDREIIEGVEISEYVPDKYESAEEALKEVLSGTKLEYVMLEKKYVIIYQDDAEGIESLERMLEVLERLVVHKRGERRTPVVSLLNRLPDTKVAYLQKHKLVLNVSGTITDQNGEPLIGVNIQVKGSNVGTTTDFDGRFTLEDVDPNAVLILSYVGYKSKEVSINGKSVLNITLDDDVQTIDEVVVTALGMKREEKSLGYSVGNLKGDELRHVNHENILTGIAGKIPGVAISSTGGPGSSVSMVIRGQTSLQGENQPLFVVDGVPLDNSMANVTGLGGGESGVDYGNAISDLNPEDIEDISILKGPSAAALYGSRAGNGVVLITTKAGEKSDGYGVTVNTSTVFDIPYQYSPVYYDYFAQGTRPYTPDSKPAGPLTIQEGESNWVGPELDKGYEAIRWNSPLDSEGNPIPLPLVSYDNPRAFFQTGITNTNNVAIQNTTDDLTYRFSITNENHVGNIPNTDLSKNGVSFNSRYNLASNLQVSANINVSKNKANNRPGSVKGTNPLWALSNLNPSIDVRELRDYWEEGQVGLQQKTYADNRDNPYFVAYEATNSFDRNRIYGNTQFQWNVTSDFTIRGRYGLDGYSEDREQRIPKSFSAAKEGGFGKQKLTHYERNTELIAQYSKDIASFDFEVTAGGNWMFLKKESIDTRTKRGAGIIVPDFFNIMNIAPDDLDYSNLLWEKDIYSVFGLASIGYKRMAYLDVTARNDWSSTLPVQNRSYFYPSASLSLIIDEMVHLPSSISLLKLRGGVAQVGKDTEPYQLEAALDNSGAFNGRTRYSQKTEVFNAQLKPEISSSYEFGLDLGLFDSRVRFSGTYYNVDVKNQILDGAIPGASGASRKKINAGLVRSKGLELELRGTVTNPNSPIQWDVGLNFTRDRTRIEELYPGITRYVFWTEAKGGSWVREGERIGALYDQALITVEDENSPYYGWPLLDNGGSWQAAGGDFTSSVRMGNFNPDLTVGMQTSLRYKRFSVNASFDWRHGGQFVSQTYRYAESDLHGNRFLEEVAHNLNSAEDIAQTLRDNPEKYVIGVNVVGGRRRNWEDCSTVKVGLRCMMVLLFPVLWR